MTIKEIENSIKESYNIEKNVRLRNLDIKKQTFEIKLNSHIIEVDFPKELKRQLIIEKLLGE